MSKSCRKLYRQVVSNRTYIAFRSNEVDPELASVVGVNVKVPGAWSDWHTLRIVLPWTGMRLTGARVVDDKLLQTGNGQGRCNSSFRLLETRRAVLLRKLWCWYFQLSVDGPSSKALELFEQARGCIHVAPGLRIIPKDRKSRVFQVFFGLFYLKFDLRFFVE